MNTVKNKKLVEGAGSAGYLLKEEAVAHLKAKESEMTGEIQMKKSSCFSKATA